MKTVVIWDNFIRLFYWLIVTLFLLNYFVTEDEPHDYVGYVLLALLVARIVWGFVGSNNARFASFIPTRNAITLHIQQLKTRTVSPYEGHNPLGGMMILLLLLLLLMQCVSGVLMGLDYFWGEEWLERTHHILANCTLAAASIHVTAVLVMSKWTKINLIKTMITGKRDIST
jgi:cytochrome b